MALLPGNVPRLDEVTIDGRVLLFTLGVSVFSSLLLALAPAFRASQVQVERGLRQGGTRSVAGSGIRRTREGLVVLQLGLSVVLLAAGGLLIRSFMALQSVPLGFQPERVLVADATVATPDPREGATLFFEMCWPRSPGCPASWLPVQRWPRLGVWIQPVVTGSTTCRSRAS